MKNKKKKQEIKIHFRTNFSNKTTSTTTQILDSFPYTVYVLEIKINHLFPNLPPFYYISFTIKPHP